jgi:hypothetical protein
LLNVVSGAIEYGLCSIETVFISAGQNHPSAQLAEQYARLAANAGTGARHENTSPAQIDGIYSHGRSLAMTP